MRTEKHSTQVIRTPEGIVFSMLLAGPISRFLACLLDTAIILVLVLIFGLACSILGIPAFMLGPIGADLVTALTLIGSFFIIVGYGICLEWFWRGRTIGKLCLRLRVVDEHGLRLQFSQIVIRNLLRAVDLLPGFYTLGGLSMLFTKRLQRLGDLAANTIVIRMPKLGAPDLSELLSDKYNSFRACPHLAARLRQLVSPHEAAIALQSLLRRNRFTPEARTELFREFAEHFRAKLSFPEEACLGLSDEQYVRNVADIVYRSRSGEDPTSTSSASAASSRTPVQSQASS